MYSIYDIDWFNKEIDMKKNEMKHFIAILWKLLDIKK